jgi:von Willebrand factor type A domain
MRLNHNSLSRFLFVLAASSLAIAQAPTPAQPAQSPSVSTSGPTQDSPVVIVIDTSEQHSGNFGEIRRAASKFVQFIGEERDVAVVAASEKPALVADFDSESDQVIRKLADIKPHGAPSMQQAVQFAVQHASQQSVSPVIVAFVRNPDTGSSTPTAPSNVPVFVIASPDSNWNVQSEMQQLAVKSGGTAFFPSNGQELGDVVKEIAYRVTGESDLNHLSTSNRRPLADYERLIVHDIPLANTAGTSETAGGEDLLMQQVLVSRIQKAKLFPIVVNGSDTRSVQYASTAPVGKVLELRASILEFRRGNRLQRQTMGFRGGSKMKLRVILVDAATNKPVLMFTKEGSYASGLWGGTQEAVQSRAILNVANAIVDELKKLR